MDSDKEKKLEEFTEEAKRLFIKYFKGEDDLTVLVSGTSIYVGLAIGYLAAFMGEDAAKAKVIKVIQELEEDDNEQDHVETEFEYVPDPRNMN